MQIKPDKHFDIETSIISLGNVIIKELLINNCIEFEKLFFLVKKSFNNDINLNDFIYSLIFLYCLGIVEYDKTIDSIKLIRGSKLHISIEKMFIYLTDYWNNIKVGDENAN